MVGGGLLKKLRQEEELSGRLPFQVGLVLEGKVK